MSNSKLKSHVLFDLDGTLADTAPDLTDTLNQVLEENGKPVITIDEYRPLISKGGIGMLKHAFGIDENSSDLEDLRQRFMEIYSQRLDNKTTLFDGMHELLETLASNNQKWGIVTNKSERFTFPLLKSLKLLDKTVCVVAGDTTEYSKPHPAPMFHACELLNIKPSDTIFIGDAKKDIEAGNSAGMTTLIASYGYIAAGVDLSSWQADGIVHSPHEITQWLI